MFIRTRTTLVAVFLGIGGLTSSQASEFEDYARVVGVTPQTEQVNQPRQQCWMEQGTVYQPPPQRGVGGSIVGGVVGGLIGSQFGGGNGRIASAAVGAVAGAVIGDRVENDQYPAQVAYEQPQRRCRMVDHWETRTNGYAVTYTYRGHTYTSVMPYHPGERIRVRVSVTPQI